MGKYENRSDRQQIRIRVSASERISPLETTTDCRDFLNSLRVVNDFRMYGRFLKRNGETKKKKQFLSGR
jgi:hypothetical protein